VSTKRWRCSECYWTGPEGALLIGPNPFAPDESVVGCPDCKGIDTAEMMCDVDGCKNLTSCGWPSDAGYRHTCHEHYPADD